jgi:hypothetical protein
LLHYKKNVKKILEKKTQSYLLGYTYELTSDDPGKI